MKRNVVYGLVLLCILLLGNRLREYNYSTVPHPGETTDEYSYGWLGLNLWKDGFPKSWSSLSGYENSELQKINVDSIYNHDPMRPDFPIVSPWFDHPPLFGMITGGYAYIKGARNYEDVSVILLRRPMIKIALITTILIFVLASQLYNTKVGLFASLLYSVAPTFVISSRLAMIENALAPLFLGSVILTLHYFKTKKRVFWLLACTTGGLAMLLKLSGVAILISNVLLVLYYGEKEKFKLIGIAIFFGLMSFMSFCLYGSYYDWQTFVDIFQKNSQRFYGAGSEIVVQAITSMRFTTYKFFTDGWLNVGWISLFILSLKGFKKEKGGTVLTLVVAAYFFVFIFFGSESYGWYKYPFFPFLVISMAKIILDLFAKPNLLIYIILLALPLGNSVHKLIGVGDFQSYVPIVRGLSLGFLVLLVMDLFWNNKKIIKVQRAFMFIILVVTLYMSIKEIYYYDFESWFRAT